PGCGATWSRFRRLAEIAAEDLSLARLAEGHSDALAIFAEAGIETAAESPLYGVWVAGFPLASTSADAPLTIEGRRAYCSGSDVVNRALVTAACDGQGVGLFEIEAQGPGVAIDANSWEAVGMAATRSHSIDFQSVQPLRQVGLAGFYEERPGFWNGSGNVAACWYGGALGLARGVMSRSSGASGQRVLLAEVAVTLNQMQTVLAAAARTIDACPEAPAEERELRALCLRDMVYRGCLGVLAAAAELGGTEKSTHDAGQARRLADLPVYLRQHHPMVDRERIGQLLDSPPAPLGGLK
ncbi:MAG: acyl-CoA dehydrogenase, partial [Tepidiformaceae bacterium]